MDVNAQAAKPAKKKMGFVDIILKYNAVVMLIVLIIASACLSSAFLTVTNIFNLLRQLVPACLASFGLLLVVLTGGIDLSVGSVQCLCGMIGGTLIANMGMTSGMSLLPVMLIVLACGFVVGCMTGAFVVGLHIAPFVATLATMTMARGAAYLVSNGQPLRLNADFGISQILNDFGNKGIPGIGLPWPVVMIIIVTVIMVFVTKNTVFGRLVIATGSNESAVNLAGIKANKYKFFSYAICGLLCAIGGMVTVSRVAVAAPSTGEGMELDAIAACVIGGASLMGGKGTVLNTVIGVLVLGLISNVMTLCSVAAYPQQIIKGIVIVLAVYLQYITSKKTN